MSAVIQQLQNDMTPGMALSNVLIDVRSEPVKGCGFVGDTRNPPRYHDVAHLTVIGMAPDDRQVAQLIDSVSKNPLFADVTLDFTRTGALHNYPVRKFEIQLAMDLEPLTTQSVDAQPARSGSVADADTSPAADPEGAIVATKPAGPLPQFRLAGGYAALLIGLPVWHRTALRPRCPRRPCRHPPLPHRNRHPPESQTKQLRDIIGTVKEITAETQRLRPTRPPQPGPGLLPPGTL